LQFVTQIVYGVGVPIILQNFFNWPRVDVPTRSGTYSFRVDAVSSFSHGSINGCQWWW